ncbi:N6-Methyl-AMP deaminase-like isoform X2 [Amphiura filiformis]|uniref:N6-Methyl-AMP deaminase-like isoform X2 n=1 Tax=Amphiura filiformis TaxID=82378 RepID=UPI003B20CDB4
MATASEGHVSEEKFCKLLPKVELHAHLNGSISKETMTKLLARKAHLPQDQQPDTQALQQWTDIVENGKAVSLDACFQMFKLIHQIVDDTEAVAMVTKDVVREFAEDGVCYLELRSTPRDVPQTGMTKRSYIETVLKAIQQCQDEGIDIIVRFILAIDRRNSLEAAEETIQLAEDYRAKSGGVVVGVDLSGDPKVGDARQLIPLLQKARTAGLRLALHIAEIPDQEAESLALLNIPTDRIGHGTFLHPEVGGSQGLVAATENHSIPLELCQTSNFVGKTVASFDEHHFKYWFDKGHPCVICTDDKGVFHTTLSKEYHLAMMTFDLSRKQLWQLSERSIDFIFADDDVKQTLRKHWTNERSKLQL